jgi:SAM-dependent methyltransferase
MNIPPYKSLSRLYDLDWRRWSRPHAAFILDLLAKRWINPARILDLGCGTGSLCIDLAGHGHAALGIDISPEMIRLAEAKAGALGSAAFEIQDMRVLTVDDKFDLAAAVGDALNYLATPAELSAVLRRVAGVLKPGGLLVVDCFTRRFCLGQAASAEEQTLGGETFVRKFTYDAEHESCAVLYRFPEDEIEIHLVRPFDLEEIEAAGGDAGFRLVSALSNLNGTPYQQGGPRLIAVLEHAAL